MYPRFHAALETLVWIIEAVLYSGLFLLFVLYWIQFYQHSRDGGKGGGVEWFHELGTCVYSVSTQCCMFVFAHCTYTLLYVHEEARQWVSVFVNFIPFFPLYHCADQWQEHSFKDSLIYITRVLIQTLT